MLERLKNINEKLINLYQNNNELLQKQLLIKRILQETNCFFKMDIETSYSVLKDLNIKDEDIKNVYQELIDIKNFN